VAPLRLCVVETIVWERPFIQGGRRGREAGWCVDREQSESRINGGRARALSYENALVFRDFRSRGVIDSVVVASRGAPPRPASRRILDPAIPR